MEPGGEVTGSDRADLGESRWGALETVLPLVYVTEFESEGAFLYISEVVREWTGHEPPEFVSDSRLWYRCIHPDDLERVRDAEQRFFYEKEQLNLEYRLVGPGGESRWVWERNTIVRGGDGVPICAHGTIVDLSRYGAEALGLPAHDGHAALLIRRNFLTGLPTRQALTEHLELAIARATRMEHTVALLDIDLDRFRAVNDSVGHSAGDIVLSQVAARLSNCLRSGDLLAHSGGDEFLMMLSDLDPEAAEASVRELTGRIRDALAPPFEVSGQELNLRASIGFSLCPDDAVRAEVLERAAHIAVGEAKTTGRGELHRYRPGAGEPLRRLSVDYRLRRAIERDEIVAHYQSIVDLATDSVVAAEALVRWETEEGLVGAATIVPAAEESSLIVDLDIHMIRVVCAQARIWRDQGRMLPLHVNVSSRIVGWHGFVGVVLQALEAEQLNPQDLVLELTETTAMVDELAGVSLTELADAGLRIAIDDFGAAYSSMARLRALPVTVVKLDRAMLLAAVGGLPPAQLRGPTSRTLEAGRLTLGGLFALARTLGIISVVEGIETGAARELALELGADQGQGYHFDRPQAAQEFERALDARSSDS